MLSPGEAPLQSQNGMNPTELHNLRRRWEAYIRVPQEDRQAKLDYLDRFLPLLLVALSSMEEQTAGQVPYFSDLQSVSSILASEFLVDIHHICSQSDDDDITQLEQYLRSGRGAILLRVLNTTGVQGLSCGRELGDLLVSLLQLSCKFPALEEHCIPGVILEDMNSCFSHLVPRNQSRHNLFPTLSEVTKQKHGAGGFIPTVSDRWPSTRRPGKASESDSGSTDSEETEATPKRYKKPAVGSSNAQGLLPLGVFPGLLSHVSDAEEEAEMSWPEMEEGVSLDPLSPLELCVLLLSLICSLCRCRWRHMSQHKALAPALLPNLLQFLYNMALDWAPGSTAERPEGWTLQHAFFLKRYLARVIVTLSSYVSLQGNGLFVLNANGVVGGLLEVSHMYLSTPPDCSKPLESGLLLAHDIVCGVWLLIHSIFQGIPLNPSYLSHAVRLFAELHTKDGLQQAQDLLLHLETYLQPTETSPTAVQAKDLISSLVSAIGLVLGSVKKAKVDYIHSTKCVRRRHRTCDYSQYLHHHHNILGSSSTAVSMEQLTTSSSYGSTELLPADSAECKAAIIGDFLLGMYVRSKSCLVQMRTLAAIDQYGLCCCMQPEGIFNALLPGLSNQKPGIRNYVLCVLTKALMEHCGGASSVQQSSICKLCKDAKHPGSPVRLTSRVKDMDSYDTDSALSSSDASCQEEGLCPAPRWHCVRQLLTLILCSSEAVSVQVTQHLLRLISQAGKVVRHEIFILIFLPLLQAIQNAYPLPNHKQSAPIVTDTSPTIVLDMMSGSPYSEAGDDVNNNSPVLESCDIDFKLDEVKKLSDTVVHYVLAALPLLLEAPESQNMFLTRGGLQQLLALFHVPAFRRCVLNVFQVLIVMEDQCAPQHPGHHSNIKLRKPEEDQISDCGSEDDHQTYSFNVIDTFMGIVCANGLERTSIQNVEVPDSTPGSHRSDPTTASNTDSATEHSSDKQGIYSEESDARTRSECDIQTKHGSDNQDNEHEESDERTTSDPDTQTKQEYETFPISKSNSGSSLDSSERVCDSHGQEYRVVVPSDPAELSMVCDVWSTCARLYPCSQLFQTQLAIQNGILHARALLRVVLQQICTHPTTVEETSAPCHEASQASIFHHWLSVAESCLLLCLSSFAVIKAHKQDDLSSRLLGEVRAQLAEHSPLPSGVQRLVCDMLLHCSMQHRSMRDIVQNHTFAVMHLHIDDSDDVEIQELSDYCSTTKESETCFTELGYEADDSEFSSDDIAKGVPGSRMFGRSTRRTLHVLLHPQLCHLVLEMLVHQDLPLEENNVLAHVLLKLISLAKHSMASAATLYRQVG